MLSGEVTIGRLTANLTLSASEFLVSTPALFLASDDAAFVNGVLLYVDGGQMA